MRVRSDTLIFESVTDAAYGLNQFVVETVIDLAAQIANVHVDQVGVAEEITAPDAVEELVARMDFVAVEQQVLQERVLFGGEVDRRSGDDEDRDGRDAEHDGERREDPDAEGAAASRLPGPAFAAFAALELILDHSLRVTPFQ